MKIYTKKGDGGKTSLWGGKRVKKSHKLVEAMGAVDELNAWLGALELKKTRRIQQELMIINSIIAGADLELPDEKWLEREIDQMQKKLPELRHFILPRNQIHIARAICRRAERAVVAVGQRRLAAIVKYLNRLSDYLFVLARFVNWKKGKKEIIWKYEDWKVKDHFR